MRAQCEDCVFNDFSECRRNPPIGVEHKPHFGEVAVWPKVKPGDWCGEFKKRNGVHGDPEEEELPNFQELP